MTPTQVLPLIANKYDTMPRVYCNLSLPEAWGVFLCSFYSPSIRSHGQVEMSTPASACRQLSSRQRGKSIQPGKYISGCGGKRHAVSHLLTKKNRLHALNCLPLCSTLKCLIYHSF